VNRQNLPFGDFRSCSGTSLRLTFRIPKNDRFGSTPNEMKLDFLSQWQR
jgi:hypothetical protein